MTGALDLEADMKLRALILCLCALMSCPLGGAQDCGGTERWGVKDGTDPSATSISLDPATAQLISIDQLLQIDAPRGPTLPPRGDNNTRLPDETHLYRIQARLVQWKEEAGETGDNDYHLVLTDDSLDYTPGGTRSHPTGHSFVGEIPDPGCLAGASGQFGTSSPFLPGDSNASLSIANARAQLQAQFPNALTDGSWNDGGGMPVEIIGIGYFDFPHGQVGRAPNNIEIHPILSITFPEQMNMFAAIAPGNAPAPLESPLGAASHKKTSPETPRTASAPSREATVWQYTFIRAQSSEKLNSSANALGVQGWEMISVVPDSKQPNIFVGFLKRAMKAK